ncbi:dihydrofolate reductase [Coelomomyces lativittatus]|nr:dihydrofolate reductase [Coelomomyces lativittatus]
MALPPCHVLSQFYVSNEKELSCLLYQRSADIGLGVPFNIASYALLTRMLAQVSGLKAKELIHMIGDAHIYSDHVEQLKILIEREPFPFPTLRIREGISDIDSFNISDFEIIDYKSHDKIQMSMSV